MMVRKCRLRKKKTKKTERRTIDKIEHASLFNYSTIFHIQLCRFVYFFSTLSIFFWAEDFEWVIDIMALSASNWLQSTVRLSCTGQSVSHTRIKHGGNISANPGSHFSSMLEQIRPININKIYIQNDHIWHVLCATSLSASLPSLRCHLHHCWCCRRFSLDREIIFNYNSIRISACICTYSPYLQWATLFPLIWPNIWRITFYIYIFSENVYIIFPWNSHNS